MKTRYKITRKDVISATKDETISDPLKMSITFHTIYSGKLAELFITHGPIAYIIAGINWSVTHVC